jgi:TatD DNase family protein
MIDSHCHLNLEQFADDLDAVLARAREAGVHGILVPGVGLAESRLAVELAERTPEIRAAVGVHPHEALSWNEQAAEQLREWTLSEKVVAIGEIGLDFYRDWCPADAQRQAFTAQLALAVELELPVVVHDRAAHDEVLAALAPRARSEGLTGVMHCFSGGPREAERTLELGFHLSFTGAITYGRGKADRVLRLVPPEKLLLETDAPYMAPVPHRGRRNEPAWVALVAEALAEKLGRDVSEIQGLTTQAAGRLFGFPAMGPLGGDPRE